MPNANKANRQVADVLLQDYKTKAPFLNFDTANTTTTGVTGDAVYAMAKGAKRIAFQNAMEGTLTIESQIHPFKYYSLFSDGTVDTTAAYGDTQTITAATGGTLTLNVPADGTIQTGSVFVYPADSFGEDGALIPATYESGVVTATVTAQIEQGHAYTVGYVISRTANVKKISFNNKRLPKDFYITMSTLEKDEDGVYTPFKMVVYKATPQRGFEVTLSSEGDPASITATFDLLEDKDGNFLDFVEITDAPLSTSRNVLSIVQGGRSADITIDNAVGAITAAIKDSSDATYSKVKATISGDNDTIIVTADADAAVGTYTVTLTDSASTPQTTVITVYVIAST